MEIQAHHIEKKYGKRKVLRDVSFEGSSGDCIGILGANGCGKSTLLSVLAGVLSSDGGEFEVDGQNLLGKKASENRVIGYVPQGIPLMEELTAKDNLRLWYCNGPLNMNDELRDGVLAMLGINNFLKVRVSNMSGGMKKRLSIGCAVAHNPQILIMDEPSAALDLVCKERIHTYIRSFKAKGGIVILATHEEQEINICNKHYILKDGKLNQLDYDGNIHMLVGKLV